MNLTVGEVRVVLLRFSYVFMLSEIPITVCTFSYVFAAEVMGRLVDSPRTQYLVKVLEARRRDRTGNVLAAVGDKGGCEVDLTWRINTCSDGQRRRCQLLELLAQAKPVYLLDEITSDLDIYVRR